MSRRRLIVAVLTAGTTAIVALRLGAALETSPSPSPPFDLESAAAPSPAPVGGPWPGLAWGRVRHPLLDGRANVPLEATGDPRRILVWGDKGEVRDGVAQFNGLWLSVERDDDWRLVDLETAQGVPLSTISAALGPAGIVVLAGPRDGHAQQLLWSGDGSTWLEAARLAAGTRLSRVVAGDGGFVALGRNAQIPVLWVSRDGRAWVEVGLPIDAVGETQLFGVVTTRVGWLVHGVLSRDGRADAVLFRSADGQRWERIAAADPALAGMPSTMLDRIVPVADRLLAIGRAGGDGCAAALVASVDAVPPITGEACPELPSATWLSDDGTSWRLVEAITDEHAVPWERISASVVAQSAQGVVSIQAERDPLDQTRLINSIWTTGDGERWGRLGRLPEGLEPVAGGLVVRGGRLVVIGSSPAADFAVFVATLPG